MKKSVLYLLLAAVLFTSCATASLSKYRGVGRIKQYDFYSYDVPSAFDGFRIGFASDFHYESRFTRKRLDNAIRALQSLMPMYYCGGETTAVRKEGIWTRCSPHWERCLHRMASMA